MNQLNIIMSNGMPSMFFSINYFRDYMYIMNAPKSEGYEACEGEKSTEFIYGLTLELQFPYGELP